MPQPGAPLPFGKQIPESTIREFGDLAEGEGAKLSIIGSQLVFECSGNGAEFTLGIEIAELLDAISTHGRKHES